MIYELICDDYSLGMFDSLTETIHRAAYLPKGRYTVREWTQDGDYLLFDPATNKTHEITPNT